MNRDFVDDSVELKNAYQRTRRRPERCCKEDFVFVFER
jgi:hypothetical protein